MTDYEIKVQDYVNRLHNNQVFITATDTIMGFIAQYHTPQTKQELLDIKQRPEHIVMPILVSGKEMALRYGKFDECAMTIAVAFWPHATIIVPSHPEMCAPEHQQTIGIRATDIPILVDILNRLDKAVYSTSINFHKQPFMTDTMNIKTFFDVPMIDNSYTEVTYDTYSNKPSAIINTTEDIITVSRSYSIKIDMLDKICSQYNRTYKILD